MNTHANVTFNAQAYRDWIGLGEDDVCLGVAPLFHITGLVGHIAVCVLTRMPLVLGFRFEPAATLDLIEQHRCTFTVGAITVFTALMNDESAECARLLVASRGCTRAGRRSRRRSWSASRSSPAPTSTTSTG